MRLLYHSREAQLPQWRIPLKLEGHPSPNVRRPRRLLDVLPIHVILVEDGGNLMELTRIDRGNDRCVYVSDVCAGAVLKISDDHGDESGVAGNFPGLHQKTDPPVPIEVMLTGQSPQTMYIEAQQMGITLRQWLRDQADLPDLGQILQDFMPCKIGPNSP